MRKAAQILAMLLLCACEGPSPESGELEEILARRAMARAGEQAAREARGAGDPRLEHEIYLVLMEYWEDLPEARLGGAWRAALKRAESLVALDEDLQRTRQRGMALQDRLLASSEQLERLDAELRVFKEEDDSPIFALIHSFSRAAWLGERLGAPSQDGGKP
ncbi:MAG: hypothetical protein RBU37_03625 [Myxococcota bacterium]|nr:hypothetical protein [Myxococcota bacterium]